MIPLELFRDSRYWIFGSVYCKINTFISYLTVSCSVFTLVAISFDRRKVDGSIFSDYTSHFGSLELSVAIEHNSKTPRNVDIKSDSLSNREHLPSEQAIVRPLAPKTGRSTIILSLAVIWVGSSLLSSPAAVFSTLVPTHK